MQEHYILKTFVLVPAQMTGFFQVTTKLTHGNVVQASIAALSGLEHEVDLKNPNNPECYCAGDA